MTTTITPPADTAPSRLDRGRSSSHNENPDDLATVDAKVSLFWSAFPDGAIDATDIEQVDAITWRVTARVWKDGDSVGRPDSTGSALRTFNLDGHDAEAFPLESAQSVAILRALRFLGLQATGKDT